MRITRNNLSTYEAAKKSPSLVEFLSKAYSKYQTWKIDQASSRIAVAERRSQADSDRLSVASRTNDDGQSIIIQRGPHGDSPGERTLIGLTRNERDGSLCVTAYRSPYEERWDGPPIKGPVRTFSSDPNTPNTMSLSQVRAEIDFAAAVLTRKPD